MHPQHWPTDLDYADRRVVVIGSAERAWPAPAEPATRRQADVQAVADHWANDAGWSVLGVTTRGDQVLADVTGPSPAPGLPVLRQQLDAAGLSGLDVQVNLVLISYQPLPK